MLKKTTVLLAPALLLAMTLSAMAAGPGKAVTDPAQAGPEFALQGEYVGAIRTRDGELKRGAQIIALGDGKFRGVGYAGGLPGAGWDKSEKHTADGELVDGILTFRADNPEIKVTVSDGVITIANAQGDAIGTLKKICRKSPTLGAKPPEWAVVLFDGTTAENFENGRITDDGLLMQGVTSKQEFGSFKMHMEFRTPFMPKARGQGRGNSGFYAQGRYEVQILDSFGLEGRDNECGGIYSVGPPAVNMCLPPLSWQTYDVDYTAAEYKDGKKVRNASITVRHNGVLIHENQELPHSTTASPLGEGPELGPVFLQDHGNPVRFRNIWVVQKK